MVHWLLLVLDETELVLLTPLISWKLAATVLGHMQMLCYLIF